MKQNQNLLKTGRA